MHVPPPASAGGNGDPKKLTVLGACGFSPAIVDVGDQPWFVEVPITLSFQNLTSVGRKIVSVRSSCGCILLEKHRIVGQDILPNETLAIQVTLDIGEAAGQFEREVRIDLDDGQSAICMIRFKTVPTYSLSPMEVNFGKVDLSLGQLGMFVKSITFSSNTSIIVDPPISDSNWIKCSKLEQNNPDGDTLIFFALDPELMPHGEQHGRVRLHVADTFRPYIDVPVKAYGTAYLKPVPGHVFASPGLLYQVELMRDDGCPVPIDYARASDDSVSIVFAPGDSTLRLALNASIENAVYVEVGAEGHRARVLVSSVD